MSNFSAQKLEDILISKGLITKEISEKINLEHIKNGTPIKEIIKRDSLVSSVELIKAQAESIGIPFAEAEELKADANAVALIPESLARKNNIFPF